MSANQVAQNEQPPRHYIEDNEAHFAFKAKWKELPGNRYTPEEIRNSDALKCADNWRRAETDDVILWPCP